jgi:Transposase DDE domain
MPAGQTGPKSKHDDHRQGFDEGKKITGRKRHILVDMLGLLLRVPMHAANIQDRDGAALVLDHRTRRLFPFIQRIYGDGGYQGPKAMRAAVDRTRWTLCPSDRRTHLCLVQPFPAPGTRFRAPTSVAAFIRL